MPANFMGKFTVNYWINKQGDTLKVLARLARFERATAWFVARRTFLTLQGLTGSIYGDSSQISPNYPITCGMLRGTREAI